MLEIPLQLHLHVSCLIHYIIPLLYFSESYRLTSNSSPRTIDGSTQLRRLDTGMHMQGLVPDRDTPLAYDSFMSNANS